MTKRRTMPAMRADSPNADLRRSMIAGLLRCVRLMLIRIGRDYERCGKAACARAKNCRGTACDRLFAQPHARNAAR